MSRRRFLCKTQKISCPAIKDFTCNTFLYIYSIFLFLFTAQTNTPYQLNSSLSSSSSSSLIVSHSHLLKMAETSPIATYFMLLLVFLSRLVSTLGKPKPRTQLLPPKLQNRLLADPDSIKLASSDYGNMFREIPASVLYPSSINEIESLIKFSHNNSAPFTIAARGQGHSVRGQAMARNGVVINMPSLKNQRNGFGITVSTNLSMGFFYADVGGEQLWIDVLHATLEHGLAPVSWTDYLYLTVGGTLSNAGISGQTFRYGPQISKVYEMDVITGMIFQIHDQIF